MERGQLLWEMLKEVGGAMAWERGQLRRFKSRGCAGEFGEGSVAVGNAEGSWRGNGLGEGSVAGMGRGRL